MEKSNKNILFLFVTLSVLFSTNGCGRYVQTGLYSTTEPDYKIVLNDDSTYVYHYRFHFGEDVSSGFWTQKGDYIFLTSNVLDVMNFPVDLSAVGDDDGNSMFIVFNGVNLLFYDWFCLVDTDTIHLVDDTLNAEFHCPLQMFLCAKPINRPTLYDRRSMGENPAFYAAPRDLLVKSEPIIIEKKGTYEISVDSVFGEAPLYYLPMKYDKFKISKNGIQDMKSNFLLESLKGCDGVGNGTCHNGKE